MATKVNVKFVIVLAAALIVLSGGVAVVAYYQLTTSGEEYEAKGDALMAEQQYEDAADMYRAAWRHDPTNIVWLTKWRDSILKVIPETQVEYVKYYQEYYLGILNQLAALQDTDPAAQRAYIEPYYRQLQRADANAESWQRLLDHVNTVLQRLPEDDVVTKQIHRYRGLARLARMSQVEERDAERQQALEDLQLALEADPTDVEVAVGIMKWRFNEWKRAHRLRRSQTADQLWLAMGNDVAAIRKQFPNEPRVILTEVQIAIERVIQIEEDPAARIAMVKNMEGADNPLLESLRSAPVEELDDSILRGAYQSLKLLQPREYANLMLPIVDRVAEARPDDAGVRLLRGEILNELNRYDEAIAEFRAVSEMPNRPVSLDGLMLIGNQRFTAMYSLSDAVLKMRERTAEAARRDELLQDAKLHRDQLAENITGGDSSPIVMLLDGRIALAEGRPADAVERLKALDDRVGGRDPEVIRLLGQALLESNILGAAKQQFERLVEMNAGDLQSLFVLADVEYRLQNLESAVERYQQILAMAPELTEARVRIAAIRAEQGRIVIGENAEGVDPVRVALIRWRALTQQENPEPEEAIAILREARREHGDSPALLNAMIVHYNLEGDAEQAMAVTNEALALYPEDKRFVDWRVRLEQIERGLTVDDRLRLIDESPIEPIEKLINKYAILESVGRTDEANDVFEEALRQSPDHPAIVERQFMRALEAKDFAEARSIASKAARLNLDSVNGLLFQARLEFAQEDYQRALATLQQVTSRLPYDPLALRLLGQTYLRMGRANDAINSLSQAFENKPDGVLVARLYVQGLIQLQRNAEALRVVKRARKFNGPDRILTDQWLALEELAGDRELAMTERRKRYEANPSDFSNAAALVRMLLDDQNWSRAREIITATRAADPDNADLARLEANWHAQQGDIERGADVLRAFSGDENPIGGPVRLAQYYADFGRFEAAVATLTEARPLQDPGQKVIELLLADLHFREDQYELAVPLFREALSAGEDTESGDVARRYADALLRLQRYQEAQQALLALKGQARDHARTNILLSRAAAGMDEDRAALNFLDAAVASAPNNPEPFIERAGFNAERGQRLEDVLQDLNQAIRLAPTSVPARQLKANVLVRNNRLAEASRELQEAVDTNPDNRDLRQLLIDTLTRMGQTGQAIVAATRASQQFPNEAIWLRTAGDLHVREGNWDMALDRYTRAYELDPSSQVAIRLGQAYLEVEPPRSQDAINMLAAHTDDPDRLSTVLLLQSQAHSRLGNQTVARQLATQSFDAANKPADIRDWFTGAPTLFNSREDLLAFIRSMAPLADLEPIYTVLLSRLVAQDAATHDTVIAELRSIEPRDMDPITRMDLYRLLGGLLYVKQQYAEAADVFRKAVALAPNDLEFNNNLAYLLARHLENAEEALAPAEKAAQLSPADPNVLDTLGWVYFQLGRLGQAQATLNQALQNAREPGERIPTLLHLAETILAQNEPDSRSRALRNAESARELIDRSPAFQQQYGAQLEAVMEKLNRSE